MKKIVLVVALLLIWQKWDAISAYTNPPPDYAAMHEEKVILYATEWCGYCKKTRELMGKHDIPFYEYDIEKSVEGRQQFDELGGKGVPVLLIDGQVIKGYKPSKILELAQNS